MYLMSRVYSPLASANLHIAPYVLPLLLTSLYSCNSWLIKPSGLSSVQQGLLLYSMPTEYVYAVAPTPKATAVYSSNEYNMSGLSPFHEEVKREVLV